MTSIGGNFVDPHNPPTLLVLGGPGPARVGEKMCVAALAQAKARGLRTHVARSAGEHGTDEALRPYTDVFSDVDCADPAACVAWVRDRVAAGERFDVVLSIREYAQATIAGVAAALGLPGNPPGAVRRVRTKDICRAALAAAGPRPPAVWVCPDVTEARVALRGSAGTRIVKPRNAMGSLAPC